jgi:hypothetical protein
VTGGGGTYSMLQLPEDEAEERARLNSIERKRDMAWWRDNVGRRRGGTSWADVLLR